VAAEPRRTPNEDAVRDQLLLFPELVAEAAPEEPAPAGGSEPEVVDAEPEEVDAEPEEVDAEPEEVDAEPEEAEPEPEEPLERAEREREEYLALAQRTQADFENYRKRAARDAAAAGERAKTGLVRELLPALDNLERALASAQGGEDQLAGGVALVHAELIGVLARNGVEPFDPSGERFDPGQHEAISTRPDEAAENGVVLDVIERGYRLNDTVLRPARVVVSG
jgi:molecular chaperone GrpE